MGCCVNRDHLLGTYPKNSIKEAWTGAAADQLREYLKKGDMSLGCQGCYELIKSKSYHSAPSRVYDTFKSYDFTYPKKMDFELSNSCNLECITCRGELSSSIRKNREKLPPMPMLYGDDFVNELEEFIPHLEKAYFAGGEPFRIGIYEQIWDKMIVLNPDIHVTVQTNGTLLTERIKSILGKLNFNIAVSIDAINKEPFEMIRKNAVHEVVFRNIQYFSDYCRNKGTELTVSFTPMARNWKEIPQAIEFCNNLKCKIAFNNLSYPKKLAFSSLPKSEIVNALNYLKEHNVPRNSEWENENHKAYHSVVSHLEFILSNYKNEDVLVLPKGEFEAYLVSYKSFLIEKYGDEVGIANYTIGQNKLNEIFLKAEGNNQLPELINHVQNVDFDILDRYLSYKPIEELVVAMKNNL